MLKHPRKDRYNPKIRKYYVIYGEEEDDISENEEEHKHEETGEVPWHLFRIAFCSYPNLQASMVTATSKSTIPEAAEDLSFRMLGPEDPDQSEVDDEEEKEAEQVNSAAKDWECIVLNTLLELETS